MGRPPLRIDVKPKDRNELIKLLNGGVQQVRVVLRALALLQLAKGASAPRISEVVPLTPQAIRKVGHRYQKGARDSTNREISGAYLLALSHHHRSSACCCRRSNGRSCRLDYCRHRGKNQRRQRKDSAGIPRHRCRTGWGDSSALVATHTCALRHSCHRCCRRKKHRHPCTTDWGGSSAQAASHTCGFHRSCYRC